MFKHDTEDGKRWAQLVSDTPREKIEDWIRDLHGNRIHDIRWLDDVEWLPYMAFMDGTHCCGLSLSDPPNWIVFKICLSNERIEP